MDFLNQEALMQRSLRDHPAVGIGPSAALVTLSFTYGALTNIIVAAVMVVSIVYTSRKVAFSVRCRPPGQGEH